MDIYKLSEAYGEDHGVPVELQKISGVFVLWELIEVSPGWNSRKEICMFHSTDEVREKVGKAIQNYAASRSAAVNA